MGRALATVLTSEFVWQRFEIVKNEKDSSDKSKVSCTICKLKKDDTIISRSHKFLINIFFLLIASLLN